MSKGKIVLPLILLLALLFALITQSIVSVTLLELRVQIAAERILNFELSSRMLKTRFRQMLTGEDNMKGEIKVNVLESSVLNFEKFELEGTDTPLNRLGIVVINGVRRLNFKQPIRLSEDREFMKQLQVAFYLERNRRYDSARAKYEALIKSDDAIGDTGAFLKLHSGYCGALTNEVDASMVRLREVIAEYPGTHYAETAQLILDLLEERKRRTDKIGTQNLTDREMARALFGVGDYARALSAFRKLDKLDLEENYMMSRSLEETGQVKDAVAGYMDVVNRGGNSDPAVKSNRRLMLIGNFYNGGKEVRQFSEQNAVKLKDTQTLANVQEGKELQLRPVIVERLLTSNDKRDSELLGEIKKDLSEAIEDRTNFSGAVTRPRLSESGGVRVALPGAPAAAEVEIPSNPALFKSSIRFSLRLKDGRQVRGSRIAFEKDGISVTQGEIGIQLPPGSIETVETQGAVLLSISIEGVAPVESSSCTVSAEELKCKVSGKEQTYELSRVKEIIAR